jgi:hypothetical protein
MARGLISGLALSILLQAQHPAFSAPIPLPIPKIRRFEE